MPKIVITMPAYRAEQTLARTVADIPAGIADELILVDDASPDGTVRIAHELGIRRVYVHQENRGYGGNQKTCYVEALREGAEVVVLLHPDYQYDPKAVPLLVAPILAGDADMTFGSRFAGLGDPLSGGMPKYRFIGNRLTTVLENAMLGSRFTDMHSGMRAYTRSCLLSLPFLSYSDDFWFDSQTLVDAVTLGQRVVEVPIPTSYTLESSSIAIASSLRYIGESLWYCFRRTNERGRRGARSPVTRSARRRGPWLGGTMPAALHCPLCGADRQVLVPLCAEEGTASLVSPMQERVAQCRRCGLVSRVVRNPVATSTGTEERDRCDESARQVLDSIGGYPVLSKRLLAVGAGDRVAAEAAARGWQVRRVPPADWVGSDEQAAAGDGLCDARAHVVHLGGLECLADPVSALRAARAVLEDEGLLTVAAVDVSALTPGRRGDWFSHARSHLFHFTPQTMGAMLDVAGFRMVEWSLLRESQVAGMSDVRRVLVVARPARDVVGKPVGKFARLTGRS